MKILIFCIKNDKTKKKQREFHSTLERLENKFSDDGHDVISYLISAGLDILVRAQEWPENYFDRVILIGHGVPLQWGRPGLYGIHKTKQAYPRFETGVRFAQVMRKITKPGAIISFASCLCAANPKWYRNQIFGRAADAVWGIASHAPGGERSLCGLVARVSNREVRGHTTAAHTTRNPAIRVFPPGSDRGLSMMTGDYKNPKDRRKWNTRMKGERAENLLIGMEHWNKTS